MIELPSLEREAELKRAKEAMVLRKKFIRKFIRKSMS